MYTHNRLMLHMHLFVCSSSCWQFWAAMAVLVVAVVVVVVASRRRQSKHQTAVTLLGQAVTLLVV